jgi:trigger factor
MKVDVQELSAIERKLSIEVEPARVEAELSRAYQSLSRQVKIAGFRAGKVPRRILEQRFKEQVEDDVIQRVVERAYLDAIKEHKVEPVSAPTVTNDKLKPDAPFRFEARVEVKPKLAVKDYKAIPLKKNEVQVDDAKVNEQLEQMRSSMTRLEPIEGRDVVAPGDFANIDFDATIDGKEFKGSKGENVSVEVIPGEIIDSKIPAIEGVKVGDSKEIDYVFPADYRVEEIRGKTSRFVVKVKGIKKKVVPDLSDDFAKDLDVGVSTLDELKAKVKADLKTAGEHKDKSEQRDAVIHALIAKNDFEVPKAMIERALDIMLDGAIRAMARGGLDPRKLGLDVNRLREEMRPRALDEVKGTLLFEAIAEAEGIAPAEEEVDQRIEQIAEESGATLAAVKKFYRNPDERRSVWLRLREDKTIEFLKSQATYS